MRKYLHGSMKCGICCKCYGTVCESPFGVYTSYTGVPINTALPLRIQLLTNASWEPADHGSRAWAINAHMENSSGVPGSSFQTVPVLAVCFWRVSQWLCHTFSLSPCSLCYFAIQVDENFLKTITVTQSTFFMKHG